MASDTGHGRMSRKEWDDTFVLDRMTVRYQPVLGPPTPPQADPPARRPSTAGAHGRLKATRRPWSALNLSGVGGRACGGGLSCATCAMRARSMADASPPSAEAGAARLAHRAAEKAAARAYMAAGCAQQEFELAKTNLDNEVEAAKERMDRVMAEIQSSVVTSVASRGIELQSAELDLPGRSIRLLQPVDFSDGGISEEGGAVLDEVALLLATCNKKMISRGHPELRMVVETNGERRAVVARERIVASLAKLKAGSKRQDVVSAKDGGGGEELTILVAGPWETLPGEKAQEEPRAVATARRWVAQCGKAAKKAREASERAQAAVGPLAEAARAETLEAQSAMDTKMQVVGEALKTLKTIDAAGGLAVDLQRLLGSIRKERERVVVEQAEAEELTKLLKSEVAKAIEERQRAAEQMKEAGRAKMAADRARWASEDAAKDARREILAARQATRERDAAAEAARREQETASLALFSAERALEEQRVAESGMAHALEEAARARESRAAAEEAMHQAVEERQRMEAGMQGMRDELAARAKEHRKKVESALKDTMAEKSATEAEMSRAKAKAAGELSATESAQAEAEAARDEAMSQKAELEEQISVLEKQVEELEEANRAAEAARKGRLAKMVEEVAAAVKRDLRARDIYLKAVDMDLPGGQFALKEDLPFKEGEAVFIIGDQETEAPKNPAADGAEEGSEETAAEDPTKGTEAARHAVEVPALDQVAAAVAVAIRELAKRNEPPLALTVECHVESDDTPLSQQRANAVKDYLVDKAISSSGDSLKAESVRGMINAHGYGNSVMQNSGVLLKVDMSHDD